MDKDIKIRFRDKNFTRVDISPGSRNCHHGMEKHGADHIPEKWNADNMEWSEHQTRVK